MTEEAEQEGLGQPLILMVYDGHLLHRVQRAREFVNWDVEVPVEVSSCHGRHPSKQPCWRTTS